MTDETLKQKALLLLRRDREFHALRQRYDRVSGWLVAADELTAAGRLAEVELLYQRFPATVVERLQYQSAALFEIIGSPPALVATACASSSLAYERPVALTSVEVELLDWTADGVCNDSSNSEANPLGETLGLGRFMWSRVTPTEQRRYLAVAGFDLATARFHKDLEEEDLSYFRMLSQHLESLLGHVLSNMELRHERESLRELNEELRRRDAELQRALNELKETHDQLVHGERLAAIGELAAGVAHEINNPAQYVLLNLGELETAVRYSNISTVLPDADEVISETVDGVQRIVTLARELHAFSRTDAGPAADHDLDDVIGAALRILDNQLRHCAVVERDCCAGALVHGNSGQLSQVFLNLLMNAAEAMQHRERERNRIGITSRIESGSVIVSMEDNGVGIKEDCVGRVFEPFFTTRKGGRGTGLGLSITQKIVEHHGGRIEVTSSRGEGTCFTVVLPLVKRRPELVELVPRPADKPGAETDSPCVLIVDDDPQVLRSLRRSLHPRFQVVTAEGAKAAFALLDRHYDAIVCDLMMPNISGPEFHRSVSESHPDLGRRFIFVTGGAFTTEAQEFVSGCEHPLLEKPFDADTLTARIAELKGRPAT